MNCEEQVVVIGAGMAGMAAAARLAAAGCSVQVLERGTEPGGKLGVLEENGFRFDTGPSLFTQPQILEALFADGGYELSAFLDYSKLEEGTRYCWEDGTVLTTAADRGRLAAAMGNLGIDAALVFRYLDDAAKLYRHIGAVFLDQPIHELKTWLSPRIPRALAHLKPAYLLSSLHRYNERMLRHPKLVQLFDRFATYNGSDPYRCPAMMSMIAHLEFNEGVFYPQGGMGSIRDAVYRLCCVLGVQFHFGTGVEKIVLQGGRVAGVAAQGQYFPARRVLSNSDVYFTYRDLLKDETRAAHLRRVEPSSSGLIFYWGINRSFPQLGQHNIFFSDDYEAEFRAIREKRTGGDPTVYVNITSKAEAAHAPEGMENWFVLVNTPAGISGGEWEHAIRQQVLAKLSRLLGVDIGSCIVSESVLDPQGIEQRTGSYAGALYGPASNSRGAAFNRQPNRSRAYPGLYFAGGSVHPGGGIPLCLRSGKLAAAAILADIRS